MTGFFQRTRVYLDLWDFRLPVATEVLERFVAETTPAECDVVQVVPLDGLRISGATVIGLPGGARLVKRTADEWADFFEAPLFRAPEVTSLVHLWAVEIRERRELTNPNGLWITFQSPRAQALDLVGRWVHYINLVSGGFVRPVAIHTKVDTRLSLRPVDTVEVNDPVTLTQTNGEEEWEEPLVSVDIADVTSFSATITELNTGHIAASARGPRVDTALHWFSRVSDQVYGHVLGFDYDEAVHEDIVPDCFTALEALLLARREKVSKGATIAERTASLIAADDTGVAALQGEVLAAYGVRNDLVHGDAHPNSEDLRRAAENLPIWVKQVTSALLRLGGNLDAVIRGVSDAQVRAANRALVPRY